MVPVKGVFPMESAPIIKRLTLGTALEVLDVASVPLHAAFAFGEPTAMTCLFKRFPTDKVKLLGLFEALLMTTR